MDTDIDQQLRDYQREYLEFLDDDVSCSPLILRLGLTQVKSFIADDAENSVHES